MNQVSCSVDLSRRLGMELEDCGICNWTLPIAMQDWQHSMRMSHAVAGAAAIAQVTTAPHQTANEDAPAAVTAAEAAATAVDICAPSHAQRAKKRKKSRSTPEESGAFLWQSVTCTRTYSASLGLQMGRWAHGNFHLLPAMYHVAAVESCGRVLMLADSAASVKLETSRHSQNSTASMANCCRASVVLQWRVGTALPNYGLSLIQVVPTFIVFHEFADHQED